MTTFYLKKPIPVTVRYGEDVCTRLFRDVHVDELAPGAPPPGDGMIANCHRNFIDVDGNEVPREILQKLDLENGLKKSIAPYLENPPRAHRHASGAA